MTDADAAIRLMEWAREKGFRIGPRLKVGAVELDIADIRQPNVEGGAHMPVAETPESEYGLTAKDLRPIPGLDD